MSKLEQPNKHFVRVRERLMLANFIRMHPNLAQGKGYLEVKVIKGNEYVYRRWRDAGRLKSEYVGKLNN